MARLSTGNGLPDVVVTGIAMTTALATDADSTWTKLLDKQSGIRKLDDSFVEEFDLPVRIGGHLLEDFDHELTRVELRRFLHLQKMSTVVGRRGWADAGSPEVDTNRLMVPSVPGWARPKSLSGSTTRSGNGASEPFPRLACRRPCPTRRLRRSGWNAAPKPGSSCRCLRAPPVPRPSPWRGATSCSAKPASRFAAVSKPRSKRFPLRPSPTRTCCRRTTTIRPARAAHSIKIATVLCSASRASNIRHRDALLRCPGKPGCRTRTSSGTAAKSDPRQSDARDCPGRRTPPIRARSPIRLHRDDLAAN